MWYPGDIVGPAPADGDVPRTTRGPGAFAHGGDGRSATIDP